MSGMITISGNNFDVGRELGRYWGGYFSLLKNRGEQSPHYELFDYYRKYLKKDRKDTHALQVNVKTAFPEIWEEIRGMWTGVNEYKKELGFRTKLSGLFSWILGETDSDKVEDYWRGCSTAVLRDESGYSMVHSDEYDTIDPLVVANVTLKLKGQKKCFTSISHPFQLFGSAAGANESFAFQGNSIPCSEQIFNDLKKSHKKRRRVPKTVLSRKLLELSTPCEAKKLYQQYPCTLPNHHMLISSQGAHSLQVKPVGENMAFLEKIILQKGEAFCHTNHFKGKDDKDDDISWSYKKNKESNNRLGALEGNISKALDSSSLERCFLNFINSEKLFTQTTGIFCFRVPNNGKPILQKIYLNYGYRRDF